MHQLSALCLRRTNMTFLFVLLRMIKSLSQTNRETKADFLFLMRNLWLTKRTWRRWLCGCSNNRSWSQMPAVWGTYMLERVGGPSIYVCVCCFYLSARLWTRPTAKLLFHWCLQQTICGFACFWVPSPWRPRNACHSYSSSKLLATVRPWFAAAGKHLWLLVWVWIVSTSRCGFHGDLVFRTWTVLRP